MSKRILIIDDDEILAAQLEMIVQRCGYTSEIAHEGVTALRLATAKWPDLFLLDWTLPGGMVGKDVIVALRALAVGRPLKIIVVTAYNDSIVKDTIKDNDNIVGFFQKPFDPTELMDFLKGIDGVNQLPTANDSATDSDDAASLRTPP